MRSAGRTALAAACLALLLCACNVAEARRNAAARRVLDATGSHFLQAITSAAAADRATTGVGISEEPLLLTETRPDSLATEAASDPVTAMMNYHVNAIANARENAAAIRMAKPASGTIVESEAMAEFSKKCTRSTAAKRLTRASLPHGPTELAVCPTTGAEIRSNRT